MRFLDAIAQLQFIDLIGVNEKYCDNLLLFLLTRASFIKQKNEVVMQQRWFDFARPTNVDDRCVMGFPDMMAAAVHSITHKVYILDEQRRKLTTQYQKT